MTPHLSRASVLDRQRHLKWRAFDAVEQVLMVMCRLALVGFSCTVFFDAS